MKWIRRGENCWFYIRDTQPSSLADLAYKTAFNEDIIDCEKSENWREIESGVLDTETGKLCITLKPIPKVPTLKEAAETCLKCIDLWAEKVGIAACSRGHEHYQRDLWLSASELRIALSASTPANPYTREAVDELLEAAEKAPGDYFRESSWSGGPHKRMARALTALKKQREAANA